jgi:hypothetical protein
VDSLFPVVYEHPIQRKAGLPPLANGTLHAAIREARKAYQTGGTIPDWEALAQAAEDVRRGGL